MSKIDIDKELEELLYRFKRLRKAIEEEEKNSLSSAKRAAAAVAAGILAKPSTPEDMQARRLAEVLRSRNILGTRPPPRQPTDEEMFGHLIPSEEQVSSAEKQWNNSINNWMTEATRPISSRFRSPEEEQAYWDNIKVNGSGGDESGY